MSGIGNWNWILKLVFAALILVTALLFFIAEQFALYARKKKSEVVYLSFLTLTFLALEFGWLIALTPTKKTRESPSIPY